MSVLVINLFVHVGQPASSVRRLCQTWKRYGDGGGGGGDLSGEGGMGQAASESLRNGLQIQRTIQFSII